MAAGQDALAHERFWDRFYRSTVPGRKSPVIEAIVAQGYTATKWFFAHGPACLTVSSAEPRMVL